jgi:hypothetical protein
MNGSYCYVALHETIKSAIKTFGAGARNEVEEQIVLLHVFAYSIIFGNRCLRT